MSNATELQVFNYGSNEVRTVMRDGEPWWVLKDVCDVLDLSNPSMISSRLDEDEQMKIDPKQYLGSRSNEPINVISESGLYNVILLSRKPEAKKFKRWVTHEVLPTIRKTGGYVADDEKFIEHYLPGASEQTKAFCKAQFAIVKELDRQVGEMRVQLDEQKPKVLFADAVSASSDTILIRELSKLLKQNGVDIGQNRLFEQLRREGYLIRQKGADYNSPTQRSMDLGLFEVQEFVNATPGGTIIRRTTKVTGKGQQYFINHFCNPSSEQSGVAA